MFQQLMARQAMALVLALALPAPVIALDAPKSSRADFRVRYSNYNPGDVIQLDATVGIATHIVLEPGEHYVYHVLGDSEAYAFTHKDNHLFLKPTAEDANTNLIVVTNRRDYSFRLTYHKADSKALYKLVIRYPETDAARMAQVAQQAVVTRALQAVGTPVNWKTYTRSGDAAIAPIHAWDDGRQTWFQFAQEVDIPTVYRVTPDGQEVLTNYHMADARTMVMHRTSARWHLRLGKQVLAIYNGAYGKTPVPEATGTASPAVRRVVRGAEPQVLPVPAAIPAIDITASQTHAGVVSSSVQNTGDTSLRPSRMWQDGGQQWMRFNGPIPAIYALDANGHAVSSLTMRHDDHTISTAPATGRWLLRLGNASLIITNEGTR